MDSATSKRSENLSNCLKAAVVLHKGPEWGGQYGAHLDL